MISLIHPSRGRPVQAGITASIWKERAGVETEWLLCIDIDDPSDYSMYYSIKNSGSDVVSATNEAAGQAKGDILVYVSDDMIPQKNWGLAVIEATKNINHPWLLKVDDCLQQFHVKVCTVPIMSRSLYEKLGYFWNPEYKSMFVDEHLYHRAAKLGALHFCESIKIEHKHYSNGKAKVDDTYRRTEANWNHGKAVFEKHKRMGFTV